MVRKAKLTVAALVLLGVAMLAAYGASVALRHEEPAAPAPKTQNDVVAYATGAPQLSSIRETPVEEFPVPLAEPLNGRVAYNENFTSRVSTPIAGRVVDLRAQPGDVVRAGDTLLRLDSPDLAAAVSDLRKAKADEARKKTAYERAKMLYDAQVFARKDYESADADYVQARAETERAALRLRNLGELPRDGERYDLRAPIPGVVVERKANPGMEARPDLPDPLFVITDPRRLWVLIDLPERSLPKVAPGQPVSIEVDAYPGERFRGKIERVGDVVDPNTRRVPVRCSVQNPERKLKPEMYARVTLLADENRKAIRVPNTALVTEGVYSYVFVERQPGTFVRRRVDFLVQDRDYSYLEDGVTSGERIVVSGATLLNSELGLTQ
ncbi:MAG TPA: efflux RND transporter periplasmic adaptor subunit [Burkholderiales bacterium]|nr:efflux RND transporter periplasmic adaptor subunit [Burkholderiales bacterium]